MEYRGSKIVPVRVPTDLLEQVADTIARVNKTRTEEPYTTSTFIRAAIREKLNHYQRSNKKGKSHEIVPCVAEVPSETGSDASDGKAKTDMAMHS